MPRRLVDILVLLLLCIPAALGAQSLPSLPKASEITTGRLPNGISYYIATNSSPAGFADFSLVRKGQEDVSTARKQLEYLPHFGKRSPWRFLADNGAGYRRCGFVECRPDATVFRFDNVPVSSQAVTDSMLLMIFDLAESGSDMAVVVCGDVASAKLAERMQVMSMMNAESEGKAPEGPVADIASGMDYRYITAREGAPAILEWEFRVGRTPEKMMPTVVPHVSRMYARILGLILKERLEYVFREYDAPLASVSTGYSGSDSGWDGERLTVRIVTEPSRVAMAVSMVATVLAEIDGGGVSEPEFKAARTRVLAGYRRASVIKELTNADYSDKCISSFLYGSDLAMEPAFIAFLNGRKIDDAVRLENFNFFASTRLDPARSISFRCSTPWCPVARETLPELFSSSWAAGSNIGVPAPADTSAMALPTKKVKIKASAAEPVTGGQLWTMSNGMKVIYKNSPYGGEFRYALMVRGGYAGIPGLSEGESAFASDMLGLYRVAGMSGMQFRDMLRTGGISMKYDVSMTDMRITGIAPSGSFQTLLKALLSLAYQREADPEETAYWRRCEDIRIRDRRLSQEGLYGWMDSWMCPGFFYTQEKDMARLGDDFQQRAGAYFDRQFASMENSLLVVVGDIPEAEVKKQVCKYLGDFRTGSAKAVRTKSSPVIGEGWWTVSTTESAASVGPGEKGFSVALSAKMSFSAENCMSVRVAEIALRDALVKRLSGHGMTVSVSSRVDSFPVDRVTMFISCSPCNPDGLPAGIEPGHPLATINEVRRVISDFASRGVPDAVVKADKTVLTGRMAAKIAKPDEIVSSVLMRNSSGKDLTTGYKDKIGAVSAASVKEVFKALDGGVRIEYIVN